MRKLLLAIIAGSIGIAGCGPQGPVVGGKEPTKVYQTIVSLSPSITEIVGQAALAQTLKGRTQACNWPPSVANVPVVAGVKPDYEKLALLKPDLILVDGDLYSAQDMQKIEELGATVFKTDARTVDAYIQDLYRLGSLLGAESSLSGYADRVFAARSEALAESLPKPVKVAILLPGPNGEHMIAATGSFQGDIIKAASGTPVGPEGDRFVPLKVEDLIAQNPDVIFTSGDRSPVLNDARLKTVAAVATKKVFSVSPDVVVRRGYRVDKLITSMYEVIANKAEGGQ